MPSVVVGGAGECSRSVRLLDEVHLGETSRKDSSQDNCTTTKSQLNLPLMILLSNGHAHDDDDDDDDLPSVGAAAVGISPGQGLDTLLDSTQAGRWLEMKLRTEEQW